MNRPAPFPLSRILSAVVPGLVGIALGWWMHRPPADGDTGISPPAASIASPPSIRAVGHETSPAKAAPSTQQTLDRALVADGTNMMDLVEAIGDLTRLSDAQVKEAWANLSRRPPVMGMGSSATVIYLWGRLSRLGLDVEIPPGWGADNFASTTALEKVRGNLPALRRQLESGAALGDAERRAVYTEALHTDPFAAVTLWMKHTKPWDFQADGRYFGNALADPKTRDAIMAEARKWQTDPDLMGTLTLTLARDWIARDPAAVEQWLNQPAQADVRSVVMQQVINVRATADPLDAWRWSESLPGPERRQALGISARTLANTQPGTGAQLIASLQNPGERQEAIREYGRILAANNLEQWKKWRDTLPESERDVTNESAFHFWVFNEPENAVKWLDTQPDGPARATMINALVDVYAERDPQVAAQWIQSIPDPSQREQAAISAISAIGPNKLDSVRTILSAVPN
jgi:hypothetical protein